MTDSTGTPDAYQRRFARPSGEPTEGMSTTPQPDPGHRAQAPDPVPSGPPLQAPGQPTPPAWQAPGQQSQPAWQAPGQQSPPSWQAPVQPAAPGWEPQQPTGTGWQAPGQHSAHPQQGWQAAGQSGPYSPSGPQAGRGWPNFRPGIVPIRPLQLSDILDGALKLVRFNPKASLGLSLAVQLVVGLVSIGIFLAFGSELDLLEATTAPGGFALAQAMLSSVGRQIPTIVAAALIPALLVYVTMQAVLGRRAEIGEVWNATRGRLLPFLGAQAIVGLGMLVLYAIVAVLAYFATMGEQWGALMAVILIGLPVLIAVAVFFGTKLMFIAPAVVVDKAGPIAALKRSWQLTQGSFWRLFGISLLASLIVGTVASIVTWPATMIALVFIPGSGAGSVTTMMVVTVVAQVLVGAVTAPFAAAVTCLLYVDQRIRKEGLDIDLINEVGRQQA